MAEARETRGSATYDSCPPLALRVADRDFPIRPPALDIGSDPDCDVHLDDPTVSGRHCGIVVEGRSTLLVDHGGHGGTFLDGVRVEARALLEAGMRIDVGRVSLRVVVTPPVWAFAELVGHDLSFRRLMELVARVAASPAPVVIVGETGTGKELIARAIHRLSHVASGPMVALNCGAIPEELCESELFGHERGAFTGAGTTRRGVFEEADGGTLLLDEIGELPLRLQAKLLRVLESGTMRRVGGWGERPVNVRVLAATHRDLVEAMEAGRFREDLYHRLATVVLPVPPLRERRADIPLLAEHFLHHERPTRRDVRFGPGVLQWMAQQRWPGNVRELRNAVHRASLLGGPVVQVADLQCDPRRPAPASESDQVRIIGRTEAEILRDVYTRLLEHHAWRTRDMAAALGLPRTTLVGKMQRVGVRPRPAR